MLRTTLALRSVISSTSCSCRSAPPELLSLQGRPQISQTQHDGREHLTHFVMQFTRDAPPFVFLRRNQLRRKPLQFLAGADHFVETGLRLALQPQQPPQREPGQRHSQTDRQQQQREQSHAKRREFLALFIAAFLRAAPR